MSILCESYGISSEAEEPTSRKEVEEGSGSIRNMPSQGPQWTEFLSCGVCYKLFSEDVNRPISLACGHTVCKSCLSSLQQSKCPFDQNPISCDVDKLPVNYALLQLVGAAIPDKLIDKETSVGDLSDAEKTQCYESARKCIEELAIYLKPLSEDSINELEKNEDLTDVKVCKGGGGLQQSLIQTGSGRTLNPPAAPAPGCVLSRPMQRKLLVLINCQLVEEEGRSRAARAARSLGERSVTELILAHQNPQQLSANLWAAVRTRGCQFLGPGMQEEVLRLILLALEDGSALSRKVLVLFVVQRLEKQYPQASKTAIGHVVQLLYRASCFKVTKREEASSLMQLKEEFRVYDSLRLEHDAQIVQIAIEAGLRISPEQWSSLLYGDALHKSHMQSIIDKHQSAQSFSQGVSELAMVVQRLGDPSNLCRLRPHLDFLAKIDPSPDCPAPSWEDLEAVMKSLRMVVQGLADFLMRFNPRRPDCAAAGQNTRYKTSLCRDFTAKASCPRGVTCTFAHSQEELEQFRCRSKKGLQRGGDLPSADTSPTADQSSPIAAPDPNNPAPHASATISDGGAGGLATPMAGLTLNAGLQSSLPSDLVPPHGAPPFCHPGPGAMYPLMQPMGHPVHLPYPGQDEVRSDTAPQVMGIRPQGPCDLGVPYHKPTFSHPFPAPPSPLPPQNHPPAPHLAQRGSDAAVPCVHQGGAVYPLSVMMGGALAPYPPPQDPYLVGPGGDMPAAIGILPSQTLESLRWRKSELISHLQCQRGRPGPGSVGRSHLDRMLAPSPHPVTQALNSHINNTVVAMRTTNTLDDMELDISKSRSMNVDHLGASIYSPSTPPLYPRAGVERASSHNAYSIRTPPVYPRAKTHDVYAPNTAPVYPSNGVEKSSHYPPPPSSQPPPASKQASAQLNRSNSECCSTYQQNGTSPHLNATQILRTRSVEPSLETDEDFIPFDPPLVSRFGPISRMARMKARNTDPVQVTAEENMRLCTPVLSVTPMCRPYPTSAPVPSLYNKVQMTPSTSASLPPPLHTPPPPLPVYSPWSGLDFWHRQIPEMVQTLENNAIKADTTTERLALQLQSVELQISMKTGEQPKPVMRLLQEAAPRDPDPRPLSQHTGSVTGVGDNLSRMQIRNQFPAVRVRVREWK